MLFESQVGDHSILIDVPEKMGGKNRGLMPPQLFVISLGSCVGAFVAKYAEEHGFDTEGMTVDVDFDKTDHPIRLTNFRVTVRLPEADCSDECRREALLHVAKHCPVHETIETIEDIAFDIVSG